MSKLHTIEDVLLRQEDKIKELIQLINGFLVRISTMKNIVKSIEDQIPNKVKDSKKFQEKQKEDFEEFWIQEIPTGFRPYEKGSLDKKLYTQEIERMKKEKLKQRFFEVLVPGIDQNDN